MNYWETINQKETYLGDLKDFNGRRIACIIHKGVAVFAQCPYEKHYLFKEDFLSLSNTLDFTYLAKIESGKFSYIEEAETFFDLDTIEIIYQYLLKTIS